MNPNANIPEPGDVARALLEYCRVNDWAGYDPYDALNSKLLESLPLLDSRLPRLVLTQALKRSPINLRPLLRVPRVQNPKGIALFLSAMVKLDQSGQLEDRTLIGHLAQKLVELRSPGTDQWCWGYSFPWQTRTLLVPRWSPNAVCTIFVAEALLNLFEQEGDAKHLAMATSAAKFIAQLIWSDAEGVTSLCYPLPTMRTPIHNANLLGAALLARVSRLAGEKQLMEPALKLARYSVSRQREDGSWAYGEGAKQQWIDNFHTGFNLGALRQLGLHADTAEFEPSVQKGFEFYLAHFFRADGAPRYFHNHTNPIDGHCVAQSLITLVELQDLDVRSLPLAQRVFDWTMRNMWDERGYFYYRVLPFCRIKTSYMRWVQAWMLLGVANLAGSLSPNRAEGKGEPQGGQSVAQSSPASNRLGKAKINQPC